MGKDKERRRVRCGITKLVRLQNAKLGERAMKKLKCFVACAFRKKDVDLIYTNAIVPTLKSLDIQAYRVDRINHNDDIDKKILQLIASCEVCVADLTYARPSVYYEAGYFMGMGKPVVFIARKDHFSPKDSDTFGNLKVHFDLQMKNIIGWSENAKIEKFAATLKDRLALVTKPVFENQRNVAMQEAESRAFLRLSPSERVAQIEQETVAQLQKSGWEAVNKDRRLFGPREYYTHHGRKGILLFYVTTSATKEFLISNRAYGRVILLNDAFPGGRKAIHIFYLSLRKVPVARIEDAYESARPMRPGEIIALPRSSDKMPVFNHFISGHRSAADFKNALLEHLSEIE